MSCINNGSTFLNHCSGFDVLAETKNAEKCIDKISDFYHKALAQAKLVKALPREKDYLIKAEEYIDKIRDDYIKINIAQELLQKAKANSTEKLDLTEAQNHINSISDGYDEFFIVLRCLNVGNIDKAIEYLDEMISGKINTNTGLALFELAKAYPTRKEGYLKAQDYINKSKNSRAQFNLVKAYLKNEMIDKAIVIINEIKDDYMKDRAKVELVKAYLKKGEIEDAKSCIKQIEDYDFKSLAQVELVKACPTNESYQKAEKYINFLEYDSDPKVKAQLELVKAFLKKEMIAEAKEIINQMNSYYTSKNKDSGQIIYHVSACPSDYYRMIKSLAKIKLVKADPTEESYADAQNHIDQISSNEDKARVQVELVKACPTKEEGYKKAKEYINNIGGYRDKAQAQVELVKAYLKNGMIKDAKEIINQISDDYFKALAQVKFLKAIVTEKS